MENDMREDIIKVLSFVRKLVVYTFIGGIVIGVLIGYLGAFFYGR